MSGALIVSGTDTGIGKTVVAAGLAAALGTYYWKPVQAGIEDGTDTGEVAALGVPATRILPEAYRLALPASPHLAAEREGVTLEYARLALLPERPLIVEGAGGLMVPLRRDPPHLMIDLFARWGVPVLLVTRTSLGTINHSLLSIEAVRARGIPVAGLLFVGDAHPDNEAVIPAIACVRSFGRLPDLEQLDATNLAHAMHDHIDLDGVRAAMGLTL